MFPDLMTILKIIQEIKKSDFKTMEVLPIHMLPR